MGVQRERVFVYTAGRIHSRTEATHTAVTNANLRQVLSHISFPLSPPTLSCPSACRHPLAPACVPCPSVYVLLMPYVLSPVTVRSTVLRCMFSLRRVSAVRCSRQARQCWRLLTSLLAVLACACVPTDGLPIIVLLTPCHRLQLPPIGL